MKSHLSFLFFLLSTLFAQAQNLVPNPSFEDYSICPNNEAQLNNAESWSIRVNTPDYYNVCSPLPFVSIPSNGFGFQYPHSGNAYAGFYGKVKVLIFPEAREYIGGQLTSALTPGKKYHISFYVSLNSSNCYMNKIGMLFTNTFLSDTTALPPPLIHNFAQVYSDTLITDTSSWSKISGSFIADSAYNYFMIGNFFDDQHIDTILNDGSHCVTYYYVDDVCVSTDSLECDVRLGVSNLDLDAMELIFYPNPATNQLVIQTNGNAIEQVNIYNTTGSLVMAAVGSTVVNGQLSIAHLPSGVYIAEIKTKEGSVRKRWVKM